MYACTVQSYAVHLRYICQERVSSLERRTAFLNRFTREIFLELRNGSLISRTHGTGSLSHSVTTPSWIDMRLLYSAMYRAQAEPVLLSSAAELSSFGYFQRSSVKEMMVFFSRTLAQQHVAPGQRITAGVNSRFTCIC